MFEVVKKIIKTKGFKSILLLPMFYAHHDILYKYFGRTQINIIETTILHAVDKDKSPELYDQIPFHSFLIDAILITRLDTKLIPKVVRYYQKLLIRNESDKTDRSTIDGILIRNKDIIKTAELFRIAPSRIALLKKYIIIRQLLDDLSDIREDKAAGISTYPLLHGKKATYKLIKKHASPDKNDPDFVKELFRLYTPV